MAEEYPQSTFYGFDSHEESIVIAKPRAKEAGLNGNIHFSVATSKEYTEFAFDLICFMDCLHDIAAADTVSDNINPISRLYYAASTAVCTPCSISQEVGLALGAQAGEKRLSDVMREAGLSNVRRAAETPFNIILEARIN